MLETTLNSCRRPHIVSRLAVTKKSLSLRATRFSFANGTVVQPYTHLSEDDTAINQVRDAQVQNTRSGGP